MISITTKELEIENDLKRKIEFICDFCNTKPTIINGSIRNYDNIIQDLYNEDILDNDDIDIIQNNKSKNEEIER